MNYKIYANRAAQAVRRLKQDTEGNIAIIFALLTIPLFLLMGFAIDLQRVNTSKNRVQYILDSAVIAGAREMQDGKNDSQIKKYIKNYFESAMKAQGNNVDCADPVSTITSKSQDISVTVKCDQPTSIMQITGTKELAFTVTSASTYGIGKVDIAFVFDISGSMGGSKLKALKDAADTAVNVLLPTQSDAAKGEVRIGMTSYSDMVDAGPEIFLKVTGKTPLRVYTFEYEKEVFGGWEQVCEKERKNGSCKKWEYVPIYEKQTVTETKKVNNTCVKERIGAEAFTDADPGPYAWIEAAEAYGYLDWWGNVQWTVEDCKDVEPLPMTSSRQKLFKYIEDLSTGGRTAGHLGIAWGWYLIAPDWDTVWPAGSDPFPYDEPDSSKAMIMMTDGEFNQTYAPLGSSVEQSKKLCDAIKKEGVKIYTVAFEAPEEAQKILAYCSSGEEFAFTPDGADELKDAYTKIAQSISDLRIRY